MNFSEAIRTCLGKYADFTGRARRSEYWFFVLFNILINVGFAVLINLTGLTLLSGLNILVSLGLLLPGIAAGVRRLHDSDLTGWILLVGLIPLIGLVLIYLMARAGTPGPNRFGPDPLGQGDMLAPSALG